MRRIALVLLLALLLSLLSGCGRIFQADYYHETDYELPEQQEKPEPRDKVTVADRAALKRELLDMVYAGQSERRISFDPGYVGDSREDLEDACGTMHREDALWAYCVQNARFEISHIVTRDEADVHIDYAASALPVDAVLQLNYAAGLEKILREAMHSDSRRLVILIGNSTYSADAMAELVRKVYRADPGCAVVEPSADVYMYSGAGRQRLYDVELDYRLDDEELLSRREALDAVDSNSLLGEDRGAGMRALALAQALIEGCELSSLKSFNTAWDALVGGKADSEGLALAYVLLCRQQSLSCRIVYGQQNGRDHCWNIIELDGQHYHVDLSACRKQGIEHGFLLNDESMWAAYRWDTSSYELCAGTLNYWTLTGLEPEPSPEPSLPPELSGEPPEPGVSPEPGETPEPGESPEPGETPDPGSTPEPEESPAPEESPWPEEPSEPTPEG